MNQPEDQPRTSRGYRILLIGFGCLVGGLALGRWISSGTEVDELQWQNIDELHRIHMVPSSYNFVESNKSYEKQLLALIHDQLLNYDPVKDQLVPGLAKTYEVSPDGLRWTFRLRDAHTPDGSKLTADDVVFSFNLCLDSRFDCKQRGNLVLGNKPIKASAVSPLTVQFDLPQPFHSFDWALAGVTIVPSKTYSKVAETPETFRQAVGVQQPEAEFMLGFGPGIFRWK